MEEGRKGLEVKSILDDSNLINHAYLIKARVCRAYGLVNMWRFGENDALGDDMELCLS